MANDGWDFSRVKTAVVNHVRKHPDADINDVAASFQEAVADVLVGAASCPGGGAKGQLKPACRELATRRRPRCLWRTAIGRSRRVGLCTDNGDGGGCGGGLADGPSPLDIGANPRSGFRLLIPPRSARCRLSLPGVVSLALHPRVLRFRCCWRALHLGGPNEFSGLRDRTGTVQPGRVHHRQHRIPDTPRKGPAGQVHRQPRLPQRVRRLTHMSRHRRRRLQRRTAASRSATRARTTDLNAATLADGRRSNYGQDPRRLPRPRGRGGRQVRRRHQRLARRPQCRSMSSSKITTTVSHRPQSWK